MDTDTATITVSELPNVAPTAEAGGPYSGTEGDTITLSGAASSDTDGTIATYAWDLDNDGKYDDATGVTSSFVAATAGTFTVGLRVTDDDGAMDTDTATITVSELPNVAPTAEAGGPYSGTEGDTITLSGAASTDTDGTIAAYAWDLDNDGQYDDATGVTTNFVAVTAGAFTVGLRVFDDDGAMDTDTATVTIDDAEPDMIPLGPVDFLVLEDLNPAAGDLWFSLMTSRAGLLTVEALDSGSAQVLLYDAGNVPIPVPGATAERFDYRVSGAGETYLVQVTGASSNVDLRVSNLLQQEGTTVTVFDTAGDDRFVFEASEPRQLSINGVRYDLDPTATGQVIFEGGQGFDSAALIGSAADEAVTLWPYRGEYQGPGVIVTVTGVDAITADGGSGNNFLELNDSSGDDTAEVGSAWASLTGPGVSLEAVNFETVQVYARSGGMDVAHFYDSPGDDRFVGRPVWSKLEGEGFFYRAKFFDQVYAHAMAGGTDFAEMVDSRDDDTFEAGPGYAQLDRPGYFTRAESFEYAHGYARFGGYDTATLFGSEGNDELVATPMFTILRGDDYFNRAKFFDRVEAEGGTGDDSMKMSDGTGDDTLVLEPGLAESYGDGYTAYGRDFGSYHNVGRGFESVRAYSREGGRDTALLHDSALDDLLVAEGSRVTIQSNHADPDYLHNVIAFELVTARRSTGTDVARVAAEIDYLMLEGGWPEE